MGLYLCVFADDADVDGVDVGSYDDFGAFRELVAETCDPGGYGTRYPVLQMHPDCDGEWSVDECIALRKELTEIAERFQQLPPRPLKSGWQAEVARSPGLAPKNLFEATIDVDGEPLLDRLRELCDVAVKEQAPIVFQ